jgi:hypothetical protein
MCGGACQPVGCFLRLAPDSSIGSGLMSLQVIARSKGKNLIVIREITFIEQIPYFFWA